jgi:hypothetical protein
VPFPRPIVLTIAGTLLMGAVTAAVSGQTTGTPAPPLLIPSMYGGDLFRHHCASCHGIDGRGQGPAAGTLKMAPPDLTLLARRNGGTFPTLRVLWTVGGKNGQPFPPSHGSREMPVWGPLFTALDGNAKTAAIRLENLVTHVESIQVK